MACLYGCSSSDKFQRLTANAAHTPIVHNVGHIWNTCCKQARSVCISGLIQLWRVHWRRCFLLLPCVCVWQHASSSPQCVCVWCSRAWVPCLVKACFLVTLEELWVCAMCKKEYICMPMTTEQELGFVYKHVYE